MSKGKISELELSDELKGKINKNNVGFHASYVDPTTNGITVQENDIWFDLANKLIKFRAAGDWVTFDYSYA